MLSKNLIPLGLITSGLFSGIVITFFLPPEKLVLVLPLPTSVVGAGLAQWSHKDDES
jgi:hypothetical protein